MVESLQILSSARSRLYALLDPTAWPHEGLSPLNRIICALIVGGSVLAIIETEEQIVSGYESLFTAVEIGLALVFLVEYAARVWTVAEDPRYDNGIAGRLRYMRSWPAIIDVLALVPVLLIPMGSESFLLRLFRLLRILRLARLGRFSRAMSHIVAAVRSRTYELLLSIGVAAFLLVISSTFLYLIESAAQPEAFGSIPRAMWWSIATLTTVGYGDVYPVTAAGKVFAALTAITGIGLIAMPTGILAAAFSEALQRRTGRTECDDL